MASSTASDASSNKKASIAGLNHIPANIPPLQESSHYGAVTGQTLSATSPPKLSTSRSKTNLKLCSTSRRRETALANGSPVTSLLVQ